MSKTLASTAIIKITGTHVNTPATAITGVVTTDPLVNNYTDSMASGTSAEQSDLIYHEEINETGASETIFDLEALTDEFGDAVVFANVKAIHIRHRTGGTLTIGGTTADQWFGTDILFGITNSKIFIPAGGVFMAWSPTTGWPVTSNTKDKFIINTSTTATYDIVIIGTSA